MKHKNFKDRAELLEAAAASIRVQAAAGVEPKCKYVGCQIVRIIDCTFWFDVTHYEFPLAVVEGKQVWEGDELYFHTGQKDTVIGYSDEDEQLITVGGWYFLPKLCSWNPPKPKTVMVELLEADVEHWASYLSNGYPVCHAPSKRLYEECARVLKENK